MHTLPYQFKIESIYLNFIRFTKKRFKTYLQRKITFVVYYVNWIQWIFWFENQVTIFFRISVRIHLEDMNWKKSEISIRLELFIFSAPRWMQKKNKFDLIINISTELLATQTFTISRKRQSVEDKNEYIRSSKPKNKESFSALNVI